jgi:heterodisulfide reductase subunit C
MALIDEIEGISRELVAKCFQCQRCSCGCPLSFEMDYLPHQIMRMIALDQRDKVLGSNTIWVCVSCETCTTRCPNDIDIAGVMDACRQLALRDGRPVPQERLLKLHKAFLKEMERGGRLHEPFFLARFKLATLDLFTDMMLGAKMFLKGKIKPYSRGVKDRAAIRRIFSETLHRNKRK